MTRKIIQIFTGHDRDVCALADDGTTWWLKTHPSMSWEPYADSLPDGAASIDTANVDLLAALKECAEYMGEPMTPTPGNLQAAVVNALIRNIRAAIKNANGDPS